MFFDMATLAIWSATIPLIPYMIWRKKHDAAAALVALFCWLLIAVMIMLERPNPDHIRLLQIVAP